MAESGAPSGCRLSRVSAEYTDLTWQPSKMSRAELAGVSFKTVSRVLLTEALMLGRPGPAESASGG